MAAPRGTPVMLAKPFLHVQDVAPMAAHLAPAKQTTNRTVTRCDRERERKTPENKLTLDDRERNT